MYLNSFALDAGPLDLTVTKEFGRLLESARELGLAVTLPVSCSSRNVLVNGLRLHFLEWGQLDAPPLVLIHGSNQSAHNWDLVALGLAERFHVVVPDLRGHGDSEWPRDGNATSGAMAADLRHLTSLLELNQPTFMGLGRGGMIMVSILLDDPGLARRAVLEDSGIRTSPANVDGSDGGPNVSKEEGERIGNFLGGAWEFNSEDEYIDQVAAFDPLRPREHIRRTMPFNLLQRIDGKLVSKHDRRRLKPAPNFADRVLSLDDLGRVTCPVLVVRGEHSRIVLADAGRRMADMLPKGKLATIKDAAHNPHSHNAAGFLAAVTPFLMEGTKV